MEKRRESDIRLLSCPGRRDFHSAESGTSPTCSLNAWQLSLEILSTLSLWKSLKTVSASGRQSLFYIGAPSSYSDLDPSHQNTTLHHEQHNSSPFGNGSLVSHRYDVWTALSWIAKGFTLQAPSRHGYPSSGTSATARTGGGGRGRGRQAPVLVKSLPCLAKPIPNSSQVHARG